MASVEDVNDEEAFVEDEPEPSFEEPQNDQVFIQGGKLIDSLEHINNLCSNILNKY